MPPPPPSPPPSLVGKDEGNKNYIHYDGVKKPRNILNKPFSPLKPAAEIPLGLDPPAPPLLGNERSQGGQLEASPFEERVMLIKSMTVQQLIEFLHHDCSPLGVTADERKEAFQTDSLDHLQLVRVILNTVLEMIKNSCFDGLDIDPFVHSVVPLLYKFRPKDTSAQTYKLGYRKSGWIDRPINLQRTLLQKAILGRDFVAVEALLNVVKLSIGTGQRVEEGEIADGIYSYLMRNNKVDGELNREEVLSEGNGFVYPSLILIMQLFVTGYNNVKSFELFKLYLSTFELSPESLSGAIAHGLRYPKTMPKEVIGTLLSLIDDELVRLPESPVKDDYWDEDGEWCDILMDRISWAPEDFGKHPGENISEETPVGVKMQLLAYS